MTTAAKGSKGSVDKKNAAPDSTSGVAPAAGSTAPAAGSTAPTAPPEPEARAPRVGDWVIAGISVLFFAAAFLLSLDWPFRAALFPRIIAGAGFLFGLVKLAGLALAARRSTATSAGTAVVPSARAADVPVQPKDASSEAIDVRTAAVAGEQSAAARTDGDHDGPLLDVQIVDDEQEEEESMEYVFATAGGRAWAAALAWVAAFFLSFFVLGAFITVPLFAFAYLKFSGKASWWTAALYAAVTGVLIFVVFREVVYIPLPESIFPGLGF